MRDDKKFSIGRVIIKSLMAFSIPIFFVLCILPGPTGKPVIAWRDLVPDPKAVTKLGQLSDDILPGVSTPTQLYKWQDSEGRWQFSEQPPHDPAIQFSTVTVSDKINTMTPPPDE